MAGGANKENGEGLGRALIPKRNKAAAASMDRGEACSPQDFSLLRSVIDASDMDAVLEWAAEGDQLAQAASYSDLVIDLDATAGTEEDMCRLRKEQEALHASSLRVPRQPRCDSPMTRGELLVNERWAFLVWRKNLARLEENDTLILTPYEKNIDIWRKLWALLNFSDLLVMVVDARDPLLYRCPDLEAYAKEIDEHKRTMLLVNKADLLPLNIRKRWADYFKAHDILYVFWSAKAATATLEGKKLSGYSEEESASFDLDTKIYGRDELLMKLQSEAESIVAQRRTSTSVDDQETSSSDSVSSVAEHVVVGFVGYPNVGKSSTINALVGEKRTGVTHTPGKRKLTICNRPGHFLPSFSVSCYGLEDEISFEELATRKLCLAVNELLAVVDKVKAKATGGLGGMIRRLKFIAEDIRVWLRSTDEVKDETERGINEATTLLKDIICDFESINANIVSKKSQTRKINGEQVKVFVDEYLDVSIKANLWIVKQIESLLAKLSSWKGDSSPSPLVDAIKKLAAQIKAYKFEMNMHVKGLKGPHEKSWCGSIFPPKTHRIVGCLEVINHYLGPECVNVGTFTPSERKFHKIVMDTMTHGVRKNFVRDVNPLFKYKENIVSKEVNPKCMCCFESTGFYFNTCCSLILCRLCALKRCLFCKSLHVSGENLLFPIIVKRPVLQPNQLQGGS